MISLWEWDRKWVSIIITDMETRKMERHEHGKPQKKTEDGLFPLAHGGCSFPSDCFYDSACWRMTHSHYLAKRPRLLLAFMVPTTWEVQKIQSQFVVFVGVYLQMHIEMQRMYMRGGLMKTIIDRARILFSRLPFAFGLLAWLPMFL